MNKFLKPLKMDTVENYLVNMRLHILRRFGTGVIWDSVCCKVGWVLMNEYGDYHHIIISEYVSLEIKKQE